MPILIFVIFAALLTVVVNAATNEVHQRCRSQPGDHMFPTAQQFSQFNSSIGGSLVAVMPSAQFCKQRQGGCTDAEWSNSVFRSDIPGAMLMVNWEQDYASNHPSLCFRNTSVCGQGSMPVYGVNATSVAHIQAGVRFAQKHNLKVAIKASGHDLLGRSTAKSALLLWTRYLENVTFHDSFKVGGKNKGSAVTVGAVVGLHTIYQATKAQGKIFVGGTAGNVVVAGGYVQGAGNSALGPLYGLAADNVLEFNIVLANGEAVTANEVSHTDLFWALRGGGAGSWDVIISATLHTFPTFDIVQHQALVSVNSSSAAAQLATLHTQHIFDWDIFRVFPKSSISVVNKSMASFIGAVTANGFNISNVSVDLRKANDALSPTSSDTGGMDGALGSRLIPANVYSHNVTAIGEAHQKLLDAGVVIIFGNLVAGAVNPKWRTAKTHIIIASPWNDDTPPGAVEFIREDLTRNRVPILDALAGPGSGSYSNEAHVREPAFQTTFFGPNYDRLSAIKRAYDPKDLFIVVAGVGSENWDAAGLCRIS